VGRKSRRAVGVDNSIGLERAGFEPGVRVVSPKVCLNRDVRFAMIVGECRPHGAAQIRRGFVFDVALTWARRDFRPTGRRRVSASNSGG